MIAGGDGKNQDFTPLAAAFRGKVRHTVLIGRDAPRLAAALAGVCTLETCATLPQAVQAAARAARAGDTVLLSPACASLDMFRDYAHRGAVFAAGRAGAGRMSGTAHTALMGFARGGNARGGGVHLDSVTLALALGDPAARARDGDLRLGVDRQPGERATLLLPRTPAAADRSSARLSRC